MVTLSIEWGTCRGLSFRGGDVLCRVRSPFTIDKEAEGPVLQGQDECPPLAFVPFSFLLAQKYSSCYETFILSYSRRVFHVSTKTAKQKNKVLHEKPLLNDGKLSFVVPMNLKSIPLVSPKRQKITSSCYFCKQNGFAMR